jgi:hypothetical protein
VLFCKLKPGKKIRESNLFVRFVVFDCNRGLLQERSEANNKMADATKKAAAGDNNHRIRITLTSRNPQSLEKGNELVVEKERRGKETL